MGKVLAVRVNVARLLTVLEEADLVVHHLAAVDRDQEDRVNAAPVLIVPAVVENVGHHLIVPEVAANAVHRSIALEVVENAVHHLAAQVHNSIAIFKYAIKQTIPFTIYSYC